MVILHLVGYLPPFAVDVATAKILVESIYGVVGAIEGNDYLLTKISQPKPPFRRMEPT